MWTKCSIASCVWHGGLAKMFLNVDAQCHHVPGVTYSRTQGHACTERRRPLLVCIYGTQTGLSAAIKRILPPPYELTAVSHQGTDIFTFNMIYPLVQHRPLERSDMLNHSAACPPSFSGDYCSTSESLLALRAERQGPWTCPRSPNSQPWTLQTGNRHTRMIHREIRRWRLTRCSQYTRHTVNVRYVVM